MNSPVVAQLSKAPVLGKVKTRMQPFLSVEQSVQLHEWLTTQILENLCDSECWQYDLWGDCEHLFFENLLRRFPITWHQQSDGNLGEKLLDMSRHYAGRPSVFIGSDCPFITKNVVLSVFSKLKEKVDLVIVPASDGGYVALATTGHYPELFDAIDWGTEKVAKQTLDRAQMLNLSVCTLSELSDIDRPEDLPLLKSLAPELTFIV